MICDGEGQDDYGDLGDYPAELPTARRWHSRDQYDPLVHEGEVRARTKDLGCHKDGKNSSSPEVLPWLVATDLASKQKGHDRGWRLLGLPREQRGARSGGTPFIPRERGVAGFRLGRTG
jgi:hypothetical protein